MIPSGETYKKKTDLGSRRICLTLVSSREDNQAEYERLIEAQIQDLYRCQRQRENKVCSKGNATNQVSDFSTAELEHIKEECLQSAESRSTLQNYILNKSILSLKASRNHTSYHSHSLMEYKNIY